MGQDKESYEENPSRRGGGDEATGGEGCSQAESLAVREGWGGVGGKRPGIREGDQAPEDWPAEAGDERSSVRGGLSESAAQSGGLGHLLQVRSHREQGIV